MIDNSPLFALIAEEKLLKVYKILQSTTSQKNINSSLCLSASTLIKDKTAVNFDGKYSINEDFQEYLVINDFILPDNIKSSIDNPIGVENFCPKNNKLPIIKALFIGKKSDDGKYIVYFQKFRNDQYITQAKYHLFFNKDTFKHVNKLGISVSQTIDCIYEDGKLKFKSFYIARQLFDLSSYYREATTEEVRSFVTSPILSMENSNNFIEKANSWERKKIAAINDSKILENYSALQIKNLAKKEGFNNIVIQNKKIILPQDVGERRLVLSFLDEEVYKGVFSNTLFQTNSKKKAQS